MKKSFSLVCAAMRFLAVLFIFPIAFTFATLRKLKFFSLPTRVTF